MTKRMIKTQQYSERIPVILYEEDNIHYAYCEFLDILGYGNNEEEAKCSFEIMLDEILKYEAVEGIKNNLRTMGCPAQDLIDYMNK
nr:MAG TPA: hypothetical protein [Caudoviricetes sp.]